MMRRRMRRRAIVGTAVVGGAAYAAGHHSATKSAEQQQTDAQQNEQTDVVAGVTIFAMLIQQGMAGGLTGVAPVAGLYPAVGAMVGSALFGSSRRVMIGTMASSVILAAITPFLIAARRE